MLRAWLVFVGLMSCLVVACSGEVETRTGCQPGEEAVCECPSGAASRMICQDDNNYGACICDEVDAGDVAGDAAGEDPVADPSEDEEVTFVDVGEEPVDMVEADGVVADADYDGVCRHGEFRCSDGLPQECDSSHTEWLDLEACADDEVCILGDCEQLPEGYGDGCDGDTCPGELICFVGTCLTHEPGDAGDDCLDGLECESPAFCNGFGLCTEGDAGSLCAAHSDCAGDTPICDLARICRENNAPSVETNTGFAVVEGQEKTITSAMLTTVDAEHGPDELTYTIVEATENGTMRLDGAVLDGPFTQADINGELVSYLHDGGESTDDQFSFVVSDPLGGVTPQTDFNIAVTPDNDAPTDIVLSSESVAENQDATAEVGTFTTTDPDDTTHTFSFATGEGAGDADNASFAIDGNTLRTAAVLNHEAQELYYIRVRTTDGDDWYEEEFIITATDANDAPTDITLTPATVPENSELDTVVGTLAAVDEDDGDTATFNLADGVGDGDNGSFIIAGSSLKTDAAFDFETRSTYNIRVEAIDALGGAVERHLVVTITDANDAPTAVLLGNDFIDENSPGFTRVGTCITTDPDASDTWTYSLIGGTGDSGNNYFEFNGNELRTRSDTVLDFETQDTYSVRAQSSDSGSAAVVDVFTITVVDENEAPTDIALDGSTVAENESIDTVVGELITIDQDTGSHSYAFIDTGSYPDNAQFNIFNDSGTYLLRTSAVFDRETQYLYDIRIETTDGGSLSYAENVTITVSNENEAPTDITMTGGVFQENDDDGPDAPTTFAATDVDVGDTETYTLYDNTSYPANDFFSFTGNTLNAVGQLNHEAELPYTIQVRVTDASADGGPNTYDKEFTITVEDENDPPTDINMDDYNVTENEPSGTLVGTFTTTDEDDGDTATYALINDAGYPDNTSFTIVGSDLQTASSFNHEGKSVYNIRVQVTDGDSDTYDEEMAIGITDINETPYFTSSPVTLAFQDVFYEYYITTADMDGSDTRTLTDGGIPAWLDIEDIDTDAGTGFLRGTPDAFDLGTEEIRVTVTDSGWGEGPALFVHQDFYLTIRSAPCPTGTVWNDEDCILSVPNDPSFEDESEWVETGDAVVSQDAGHLDLTEATPCSGAGATTTYDLGEYADVGGLRLDVNFRQERACDGCANEESSALAVRFDESFAMAWFDWDTGETGDVSSSLCVGEAAYGDSTSLFVGPGHPLQDGCDTTPYLSATHVYDVTLVEDDSCPAPGTVANGDFEADDVLIPGWEISDTGVTLDAVGGGDNELQLNRTMDTWPQAEGTMVIPTTPGQALSFDASGDVNSAIFIWYGQDPLYDLWARWLGTGETQEVSQCLPEWMLGTGQTFRLEVEDKYLGGDETAQFNVDNFEVVQDNGCIPDSETGFINGSFDNGLAGWWIVSRVETPYELPDVDASSQYLHTRFYSRCWAELSVAQSPVVPEGANTFSFEYRKDGPEVFLILGTMFDATSFVDTVEWLPETICIGGAAADRPLPIRFDIFRGDGGECTETIDRSFDIDNVEFTYTVECD